MCTNATTNWDYHELFFLVFAVCESTLIMFLSTSLSVTSSIKLLASRNTLLLELAIYAMCQPSGVAQYTERPHVV